jgi:hypothetical protein
VQRYTALWNIVVTPAFLAKLADTNDEVKRALRVVAAAGMGAGVNTSDPEDLSALAADARLRITFRTIVWVSRGGCFRE